MGSTEQPSSDQPRKQALVFMPKGGWNDEYYRQLIQPTLEAADYACRRGKALYSNCDPRDEIIEAIRQANVVICWMIGRDPDVIYALGVAQALETLIVLITSSNEIEDIPIGTRGYSWIEVQQANPRWGELVGAQLVRTLASIPMA